MQRHLGKQNLTELRKKKNHQESGICTCVPLYSRYSLFFHLGLLKVPANSKCITHRGSWSAWPLYWENSQRMYRKPSSQPLQTGQFYREIMPISRNSNPDTHVSTSAGSIQKTINHFSSHCPLKREIPVLQHYSTPTRGGGILHYL